MGLATVSLSVEFEAVVFASEMLAADAIPAEHASAAAEPRRTAEILPNEVVIKDLPKRETN
jgi:hypothetical protein